jgi:hypothetical protein
MKKKENRTIKVLFQYRVLNYILNSKVAGMTNLSKFQVLTKDRNPDDNSPPKPSSIEVSTDIFNP